MIKNKYTDIIKECELKGDFNAEITKISAVNPDQKRKYLYTDIFSKVFYFIMRLLVIVLAPLIGFFGFRLKVKGRKNIRTALKTGAISVSNHALIMESLFLKNTTFKRYYYVGGVQNNKLGFGGYFINVMGNLPLSTDFSSKKKLDEVITKLLDTKHLIHIDPEATMWIGYDKIRPFFSGAFHFAAKNKKPVLPIVFLITPPTKLDKLFGCKCRVTMQILPPIKADESLPFKEQVISLRDNARNNIIKAAEEFYGYPVDVTKIDFKKYYGIEDEQEQK
jgi:1-acyl-sn-glycerol-3-phosphate acyltransferase